MRAKLDEEGRPVAFYAHEINGDQIPEAAIEITPEQWRECLDHSGMRRFDDEGHLVECAPAPPPQIQGMPEGFTDANSPEYIIHRIEKDPLVSVLSDLVCASSDLTKSELAVRVLERMEGD